MGYIKVLSADGVTDFEELSQEQLRDIQLAILLEEERMRGGDDES